MLFQFGDLSVTYMKGLKLCAFMGNVFTNLFMWTLATVHVFFSSGALFQALMASLVKVLVVMFDLPCSIILPVDTDLVVLAWSVTSFFSQFCLWCWWLYKLLLIWSEHLADLRRACSGYTKLTLSKSCLLIWFHLEILKVYFEPVELVL